MTTSQHSHQCRECGVEFECSAPEYNGACEAFEGQCRQCESKFVVCPACDGEGFQSRLGAFTSSDMDEWYGDDWDAREEFVSEYTTRGGAYDEPCPTCKGQRVITRDQAREMFEMAEYEAEAAAERRMGC